MKIKRLLYSKLFILQFVFITTVYGHNSGHNLIVSFNFKQKPLKEVLSYFINTYQIPIAFQDDHVKNIYITCLSHKQNFQKALTDILKNSPVHWKKVGKQIIISKLQIIETQKPQKKEPETVTSDEQSDELTAPRLNMATLLDYPRIASKFGIEGIVEMNLLISKKGEVKQVRIAKSSKSKILDKNAVDYGKRLLFEPAKIGQKPTSVWLTWTVNYRLNDSIPTHQYFIDKKK